MVFLGKLSHGVYMLHPLAIVVCVKWLGQVRSGTVLLDKVIFDAAAVCLAVAMAVVININLEKPFLLFRNSSWQTGFL